MPVYYNAHSRSLRELTSEKKIEIQQILLNPLELKKRNSDLKYRLQHDGKSLPIFSFQDGKGEERGSERLLYTYWDGHCIVLDYVTAHDYHKAPAMKRQLMRSWFSALKQGNCDVVEINEEDGFEIVVPETNRAPAVTDHWVPATIDTTGRCLIPSVQQQQVAFGEKNYPLVLQGVAGSGKTLVLTLVCHFVAQTQAVRATADLTPSVIYAYPNGANLLGAKMNKEWEALGLLSKESPERQIFKSGEIDDFLPVPLRSQSLALLQERLSAFIDTKKKQLSCTIVKKQDPSSLKEKIWHRFFETGLSAEILFEYFTILLVLRSVDELSLLPLNELISARGGLSSEIFQIIEQLYSEVGTRPGWQDLRKALQRRNAHYHMAMIDEAQNIPFIVLCYILNNTTEQKVIYSGDRNQSAAWNSVSSLELLEIFLNRRGIQYQKELFEKHYRCPQDIWSYAQTRVLGLKAQFFGEGQYQRDNSLSTIGPEDEIVAVSNLFYLKMSEEKCALLSAFFDNIPDLSADCFVIAEDIKSFEKFSQQYLNGKRLIILTPQQAAGLEVKTVIAFNPLDWGKIKQLAGQKKQKVRSKNLTEDEQQVYEQLNHFYVTLTRSTANVLILESVVGSRSALQQEMFHGLKRINAHTSTSYETFSPEALREIYCKIGADKTGEGRSFYQRYREYIADHPEQAITITLDALESESSIKGSPQPAQAQALGEILNFIAGPYGSFEKIKELSSMFIARLLFEPYGKKKISYWERLLEQKSDEKGSPTTEKIVWNKFLSSRLVIQYLGSEFYEQAYPESDKSIGQWLLSSYVDLKVHYALKKELVEKSLEGAGSSCPLIEGSLNDLIEQCHIKQIAITAQEVAPQIQRRQPVVFSAPSPKKITSKKKAPNVVSCVAEKIGGLNVLDMLSKMREPDLEQEKQVKLTLMSILTRAEQEDGADSLEGIPGAIYDYLGYYRSLGMTSPEVHKKAQDFMTNCLVSNPAFWVQMCDDRYRLLQALAGTEHLFIERKTIIDNTLLEKSPENLLLFKPEVLKNSLKMIEALYLRGVIDHEVLAKAIVGVFVVLNYYVKRLDEGHKKYDAPLMFLLSRLVQPVYFNYISAELIGRSLLIDRYWKDIRDEEVSDAIRRLADEARDHNYSIKLRKGLADFACRCGVTETHLSFAQNIPDLSFIKYCEDEEAAEKFAEKLMSSMRK